MNASRLPPALALGGGRGSSLRADCIEDIGGSLLNVRQTLGQELRVTFIELNVVLRR